MLSRIADHRHRFLLLVGCVVAFASPAYAQSPAEHLLRLVPHNDIGVCVLVPNLRDNAQVLSKAVWLQRLETEPFAEGLLKNNPYWAQIEAEIKKHLQIDWPELRDDILGDALVIAYRPAEKSEAEQGLLLLHTRNAARLAKLVERINDGQKSSGDLKELVAISHGGKQYFRRVEKTKTHFYYVDGHLLAFASTEAWIKRAIDQSQSTQPSSFVEQFRRSGADKALASLWLNPELIAAELKRKAAAPAESLLAKSLQATWRALDGIFLTAHVSETIELRVSVQARVKDMPPQAAKLFAPQSKPSDLWRQFPSDSIIAVAGRIDLPAIVAMAEGILPPKARDGMIDVWRRSITAATGLDFTSDVLPNVGPDWGFAIWPAIHDDEWPHALAAFAVRPGTKSLDKSVFNALHVLAGLAVFDFNLKHSTTLRLVSEVRDKLPIHYLDDANLFPAGVKPALALKNGYLIVASTPDAVARFGKEPTAEAASNEAPLVRISLVGVVRFLDSRREHVVSHVAEKNGISKEQARDWVSRVRAALDPFARLQLVHRTEPGQASWVLRLEPKK